MNNSRRTFLSRALTMGLIYGTGANFSFAQPNPSSKVADYGEVYKPPHDLIAWMESLNRPDLADGARPHSGWLPGIKSCCSGGDAYPIEIIEDATPPHGGFEENGVGRVLDGSKRQVLIPSNSGDQILYRPEIAPDSLTFHFSSDRVTREIDGNPTKTAWLFARVAYGVIEYIYCIVPLPPAM